MALMHTVARWQNSPVQKCKNAKKISRTLAVDAVDSGVLLSKF